MPTSSETPNAVTPDDALPPVEPPSGGFLLQLFIVPGIIVLVVVAVWSLFGRLAQTGSNPDDYVKELERGGHQRWMAAWDLVQTLRTPGNEAFKNNPAVVDRLARILRRERESASSQQSQTVGGADAGDDVNLEVFVCRAIGEFKVANGVPVLLEVARERHDNDDELKVRRAAISGISRAAANLSREEITQVPQLMDTLVRLADDPEDGIQGPAAFALGVIGGPQAVAQLEKMVLGGRGPDARYNAALGLARAGNENATETLVEMVSPEPLAVLDVEPDEESRSRKQASIRLNALRAMEKLFEANPNADVESLKDAVQTLVATDVEEQIKVKAMAVLAELKRRPKSSSTAAALNGRN